MTASEEILLRARNILASCLHMEADELADDAAIGTVASWDSLGHMRLMLALEEQLGRELPAEVVVKIASLQDVAAVLTDQNSTS